ncbi:MAG: hypothetical protein KatS3mg102_2360 [Planctomycetota bacterium]|nr:MAG: hypothetical protein KatS3mg102_2360 [Planctomycetota bacterium]
MRIRRLAVQAFRGFRERVELEFAPGFNLIYGPNEAGKSTLLEALEVALFERHRSKGPQLRALRPAGTELAPEVAVELEVEGAVWRVRKRLLERPEVQLERAGETLAGEQAERALAELLRAEIPRRQSTEAHRGVWPLFWIRQDRALANPTAGLSEGARRTLEQALGGEIAGVLGQGAEALLARVQQRCDRYWTDKQARPRKGGPLAEAEERLARLQQEVEQARRRWERARELADAVAAAEAGLERCAACLRELEAPRAQARLRLEAVQQRERARAELVAELQAREQRYRRWLAERDRRQALATELQRTEQQLHALAGGREQAQRRATAAAALLEASRRQLEQAREAERAARLEAARLRAAREALGCAAALQQLQARRARLQQLGQERAALRAALGQAPLGRRELEHGHALARTLAEARARLEAVATRVEIAAEAPLVLERGPGEQALQLEAGEERVLRVDAPLLLRLPGLMRLRLCPGGEQLQARRAAFATAQQELDRLLRRWNVPNLEELAAAVEQAQQLQRRLGELEVEARALAPEGELALEREIEELRQRLAEALERAGAGSCEQLRALGPVQIEHAEQRAEHAAELLRRAEQECARAEAEHQAAGEQLRHCEREQQRLEQERQRRAEELARAREVGPDDEQLQQLLAQAAAELESGRQALRHAEQELERLEPARTRAEAERLQARWQQAEQEHAAAERRVLEARARLREAQGAADYTALDELEAQRAEAAAELEQVRAEAEAVLLLQQVLQQERERIQQRYLEPVRQRVDRWLAGVMGCERGGVRLAPSLEVEGLQTPAVGFEELSAGTREQLGLLVRLGLADVVAGEGTLPVVLDDNLVWTDEQRLERMLQVLAELARRLQLIVLTCHPERYAALADVHRVDLAILRRVGATTSR